MPSRNRPEWCSSCTTLRARWWTTLVNGEQKPGYYNLTWDRQNTKGRNCACGVYLCTLSAENQHFSRKVILTE